VDRDASVDLATADGHDRHVPSEVRDFLAVGHEGVYAWAAENLVEEGSRFLDLGCGTGYGSSFVTAKGGTYDGLDASPAAIDYARRRFERTGVRFFVADVLGRLPAEVAGGSFDVVFSSEVLEHVVDPFGLVRLMGRLIAAEGTCFVGTPNRLWSRDHMPGGGLMARSHLMEFTPPALEALLQTVFEQVTVLYRMFPAEAIGSSVLPAERPRLVRAARAFVREVAPGAGVALMRSRRGALGGGGGREWTRDDILWLDADDPRLDTSRCVGLAAVCRGPRR
jgi:2-polyprenyl-3-methyl-5-hydroxy-6-metoxy-1,4-benzoquinol methylase